MIILGIDPGFARLGYGVIKKGPNGPVLLSAGTIETRSSTPHEQRLMHIHDALRSIATQWKPDICSVEKLFFAGNQKTAIPVAEARGIILLTAALEHIKVYEYTPPEVKLAVTGSGTADKKSVQKMVTMMLGAGTIPGHDDAIDAIALAMTAAYDRRRVS